jgi:hypothetical protein
MKMSQICAFFEHFQMLLRSVVARVEFPENQEKWVQSVARKVHKVLYNGPIFRMAEGQVQNPKSHQQAYQPSKSSQSHAEAHEGRYELQQQLAKILSV